MLRLSSPIYLEFLAICLVSSSAPFSKPSYFSSSLVKKFTKQSNGFLKFGFSKKATKIDKIFTDDLTLTTYRQIDGEGFF